MNIRDYTLIARYVSASTTLDTGDTTMYEAGSRAGHVETVGLIADALAYDNPTFDRQWFLRACGVLR
jgi:hypothetical protein